MYLRKTKRGGIIKIVREHYLRDDIWCGSEMCSLCEHDSPVLQSCVSSNSALCPYPHYIIPDTNVVLHQVSRDAGQVVGQSGLPLYQPAAASYY